MSISSYLTDNAEPLEKFMGNVIPRDGKPEEVYGLIWDLLDRGGKRFRPLICLLSCRAVGGDAEKAIPAAVSIELFHNFTLIHDDIMDASQLRRGKPCLHIKYGTPLAINAGDGLFMMSWKALLHLDLPPDKTIKTQSKLLGYFTKVLEGQAIELSWQGNRGWNISEDDYFSMVEGKTSALIEGSCHVGAFLGGGTEKEIESISEFGKAVGTAFQIQDDILNLVGEEEKYKKEIGGDISEGKRTLMVIHSLNNAGEKKRKDLISILCSNTQDKGEILRAIGIIKSTNSIEYAKKIAKQRVEKAKKGLSILQDSEAKKNLLAMADFLIERDF